MSCACCAPEIYFKTADYEATPNQTISISGALPADHLARCVVDVVAQLDLQAIYARYGAQGGEAYAPSVLVALLFYGTCARNSSSCSCWQSKLTVGSCRKASTWPMKWPSLRVSSKPVQSAASRSATGCLAQLTDGAVGKITTGCAENSS